MRGFISLGALALGAVASPSGVDFEPPLCPNLRREQRPSRVAHRPTGIAASRRAARKRKNQLLNKQRHK